jgi:hypothetical protein
MSVLPLPEPLEQPPGDPQALVDVAADMTAAARRLEDLAAEVGGAPARVPGWRGADAEAATARTAAVAGVSARAAEGLRTAAARLIEHADRWQEVRGRVQALRAEQDEDYAVARIRVATPFDPCVWGVEGADMAVLEALETTEENRRRVHASLLADLAADTAATERALAAATAGIDGGAGSAARSRVLVHLTAEFPAWARTELAHRGRTFAGRFLHDTLTPEEIEELATEAAALALLPGFAAGFFAAAGLAGTAVLFESIGTGRAPADGVFAGLLVRVLSGLDRDGGGVAGLAGLLAADGPAAESDALVAGVAAVLALAAQREAAGPPPGVLLSWGRDLLARERVVGGRPGIGVRPAGMSPTTADPVALVARGLISQRAAGEAVQLLREDGAWAGLLHRAWDDGGALLGELVQLAGTATTAGPILRRGLEELGTGLHGGRPDGWVVDATVVRSVAPAFASALGAHVAELVDLLMVGVNGNASDEAARALQGLGYLSVDPSAATAIEAALRDWRGVQPGGLDPRGGEVALPAVAVPAAFFAVREFGQRLLFVLDYVEKKEDAERRERIWDATVGVAAQFAGGRRPLLGQFVGALEAVLARAVGWDGRFETGTDRGLRFDAGSAATEVLGYVDPADESLAAAVAREAVMGFMRAAEIVRVEVPPESPGETWRETVLEGAGFPMPDGPTIPDE